jgi:uncharacterized membrane protein
MNGKQMTGAALALAAASMFSMLPAMAAETATVANDVHCHGVNACKGQNDCATDKNACKGQGSCKGQGWVTKASAEECTAAGGTVDK